MWSFHYQSVIAGFVKASPACLVHKQTAEAEKLGSRIGLASLEANNTDLVNATLDLFEEGQKRTFLHPKKDYVLIVGKAGTG